MPLEPLQSRLVGALSQADTALTQDIKKAAAPIGLVPHDHLIIRGNSHTIVRDLKLI